MTADINLGADWARAGTANPPDGLRWRIVVPGGADPVSAARASHRAVISAGLLETGADGVERLVRSAHVPLRDYDDRRLLFRLRRLAVRLPTLRRTDLERGAEVAATPLEWPETHRLRERRLHELARRPAGRSALVPVVARAIERGTTFLRYQTEALTTYDRWRVGIVDAPIHRFLDPCFIPDVAWYTLDSPQEYAADPFAAPASAFDAGAPPGALRVFYEYFNYDAPKGVIDAVDWTPEGGFGASHRSLEAPSHLSYPHVMAIDGTWWMMPENADAGGLRAYPWTGASWGTPTTILEDFRALDATWVEHDGRWWLFASNAREEPVHTLHVWHAPHPLGPFVAHEANPVLLDPRCGRPGGSMFHHEGRLYRAAQDGSHTYGGAIVLTEVTELTPRRFAQRVVRRISPALVGGGDGLHTLTAIGARTLIDVKDSRAVPSETRRRLLRRFGL